MRFAPETYKRCIREGRDAFGAQGMVFSQCPYNRDDRAGAWQFGKKGGQRGWSLARTWLEFKRQENM